MSGIILKNVKQGEKKFILKLVDEIHKEMRIKHLAFSLYISFLEAFIKSENFFLPRRIEKSEMNLEEAKRIIELENFIYSGIDSKQITANSFLNAIYYLNVDLKKIVP